MTPVSNAPSVDAQIVGNAFVQKYYTHLYEKPAEVYKFYLEESVLGRPGVGGEMVSVKSLKAINDQIMSVDYQNSKIQILTADSQASLKSAVVTLVAGLVIGKDGERKSFTQSFFLVPQNGSYFVLNDVFRYVSDVFVAPEAAKEAEVEAEVEESPKETVSEPAKEVVEPAAKATNEEKVVNGNSNLPKAAAEAKPQEDAGPKKSFAVIAAQSGAQINAKASPVKPKPVEKPRIAPQAEAPAPVATPPTKAPSAKTTQQPAQCGSIFVANLPMDATPEQLFETFKGFGAIRRGGIQVRSYTEQRNCFGFVAFENSESIKNVFKCVQLSRLTTNLQFLSETEEHLLKKNEAINNNENGGRAYARNNGNNRNENGYRKDGYRPRGNGGRGSGRNGPERQSGDAKASQNGHGNAQAKN
ncbi:hypothetical protein HID58_076609 [Brassica napus]|uniref:Uncharacterized protein n=1 Tax=Brassica napus TaxID=3708 RepID=A0ABQ7YN94_BRANA|nr:hypothetical protein HID58_076609 [Brassica napus]